MHGKMYVTNLRNLPLNFEFVSPVNIPAGKFSVDVAMMFKSHLRQTI
jgi:hypothetical protein